MSASEADWPTDEFSPAEPSAAQTAEFAIAFKQCFRPLWYIALGIVNDRTLAEDVVQEAAVVALGKLHQFTPGTKFQAWMGQIVRFVALNTARDRRKRTADHLDSDLLDHLSPGQTSHTPGHTPAASAGSPHLGPQGQLPPDQGHFDDQVLAALKTISGEARTCLFLRTFEGMDYAEISLLLGIPAGTAMSHVHRARQVLRQRLAHLKPPSRPGNTPRGGSSP